MTVSPTKGRAVGVLAVPEAPSEHMGKTPTEITAGSELRDGISEGTFIRNRLTRDLVSSVSTRPKEGDDIQQTRWICVPGCCSPPVPRSRVRTRPVRFPRTGRTQPAQLRKPKFVFGIKPDMFWSSHRKPSWT
jgi:hypothetical protein